MNANLEYWSDFPGKMFVWWFTSFVQMPAVLYATAFGFPEAKKEGEEKEVRPPCHLRLVKTDTRYVA